MNLAIREQGYGDMKLLWEYVQIMAVCAVLFVCVCELDLVVCGNIYSEITIIKFSTIITLKLLRDDLSSVFSQTLSHTRTEDFTVKARMHFYMITQKTILSHLVIKNTMLYRGHYN